MVPWQMSLSTSVRSDERRAGVYRHHLHEPQGPDRAARTWLEGRVLRNQHGGDEGGRHLLPLRFPHDRPADAPHEGPVAVESGEVHLELRPHQRRLQSAFGAQAVGCRGDASRS
jgi:hypothetical protein